jgi:hypothetical protein
MHITGTGLGDRALLEILAYTFARMLLWVSG